MSGFVILLLLVLFVGYVVFAVVDDARRFAGALQRVAAKLGGRHVEGGFLRNPAVAFRIRGREAEMDFYGGSKNSPPYSRIRVDMRGVSPGILKIVPEGLGESFLKLFGAQDLRIGDAEFDDAFVVRAMPLQLVPRIFSRGRGREAVESVWALDRFRRPSIDLGRERLVIQVRRKLREEADILALVAAAETWVGLLVPEATAEGIAWVSEAAPSGGDCQICGTLLEHGVVACAKCRTKHHRECWEYTGECSTYACRERRFV